MNLRSADELYMLHMYAMDVLIKFIAALTNTYTRQLQPTVTTKPFCRNPEKESICQNLI